MKRFKENSKNVHFGPKNDLFWSHCAEQQFFSKIRLCHFIYIPQTKLHAKNQKNVMNGCWEKALVKGRTDKCMYVRTYRGNSIGQKITNACDQKNMLQFFMIHTAEYDLTNSSNIIFLAIWAKLNFLLSDVLTKASKPNLYAKKTQNIEIFKFSMIFLS